MGENTTSSGWVQYLSNHFEMFFSVVIVFTIFFLILFLSLKFREIPLKKIFYSTLRGFLFFTVVAGQMALVFIAGYLWWINYKKPVPVLRFPEDVISSTRWVKSPLRIYFLDGNHLRSIKVNGLDPQEVFTAEEPIKEYHFSPDGRYLLAATLNNLYIVDLSAKESRLIDSLGKPQTPDSLRGSIGGIRWSPDSRKFCYETARWSQYSSQDNLYVYMIEAGDKKAVRSPTRRISDLYWDRQGENLYYLRHEAKDTSVHGYRFDVHVFRISLSTLQPEFVTQIPSEQSSIPVPHLNLRGIDLFLEGDALSFRQDVSQESLVSETGAQVGIDKDDYLFYVPNQWFRRRLFQIPRETAVTDMPRYQYKGGDLAIRQIRWIPGGRYVIMQHRYFGILILEPSTRKVGLMVEAHGHTFGWHTPF